VIRQVASISPCWKIEYLGAGSEDFSETLPSKQSYYIYFKVSKSIAMTDQSRMPEYYVTTAIESLLSGKGIKKIEIPEIDLNLHLLTKVRDFFLFVLPDQIKGSTSHLNHRDSIDRIHLQRKIALANGSFTARISRCQAQGSPKVLRDLPDG
jgi:hypothetical protein